MDRVFFHTEYQVRTERLEAEIAERSARVDTLTSQLEEARAEKSQLEQQVASINSLLEASQSKKEEENIQVKHLFLAFTQKHIVRPDCVYCCSEGERSRSGTSKALVSISRL